MVGEDGEQIGVVPIADAMARAEAAELDLVEIAPLAKPPVCRIMDFGKFKYREAKRAHEAKLKLKQIESGRITKVIEGHEDEEETFQKTLELLRKVPDVAGIYVNTVNCLPVCRALGAAGLAGKIKLIATDLFPEMSPYLQRGTITASIYQHPHRQGQVAVRVMVDYLVNKAKFPPKVHFSPGLVMASNLNLFREMRLPDSGRCDCRIAG